MIEIYRTTAADKDFRYLVAKLDIEMAERDGEDHSFYQQFNQIQNDSNVVLVKKDKEVIGCGAIKPLDQEAMEVKRMFVLRNSRGKGYAGLVLSELEKWAFELGYSFCRLETGKRQPEAISLYNKKGYRRINNYGQYLGVDNSLCFEKFLGLTKT